MDSALRKGACRKPIFDVVRSILGRGFTQNEVARIDRAIDDVLSLRTDMPSGRLGGLSEAFETGGRGPGTVSSGLHDPGGVSYGIYQLSSRAGIARTFVLAEGARWKREFGNSEPGSAAFTAAWRAIADREPDAFAEAQHAFIERTHYWPTVAKISEQTGLELNSRHPAVRDATWSVAVQHGRATRILASAVAMADKRFPRGDPAYDRALVEAIYAQRTKYVSDLARRSSANARKVLLSIAANRYPAELTAALAMFADSGAEP